VYAVTSAPTREDGFRPFRPIWRRFASHPAQVRHNCGVYENVIVPFDGTQPGRAALAPAADLAWRCGARIVIVNNTEVSDTASRAALKTRAMSMSGADVDFWVDVNRSLGDAIVEATRFRTKPLVCIAMKAKPGIRKRFALTPLAEDVLGSVDVPVLVVGPNADTSRGLPMVEVVASLDGSPASEQILRLAADWARSMKLRLVLVGVVSDTAPGPHTGEIAYLKAHAAALTSRIPDTSYELISAPDPVSGLVDFMEVHDDALLCMSTHGRTGGRSLIGNVALGVLGRSPAAVLLAKPLM
jgi:nucleotide-binding universal stress UspA family protein